MYVFALELSKFPVIFEWVPHLVNVFLAMYQDDGTAFVVPYYIIFGYSQSLL